MIRFTPEGKVERSWVPAIYLPMAERLLFHAHLDALDIAVATLQEIADGCDCENHSISARITLAKIGATAAPQPESTPEPKRSP